MPRSTHRHPRRQAGAALALALGIALIVPVSPAQAAPPNPVVLDINQTTNDGGPPRPGEVAELDGFTYFSGSDERGREVWRTDGTPSGTTLVADIVDGGSSKPRFFTTVGDVVFFVATDGDRYGLWKTNGTSAGTKLVRSIGPGLSSYGTLTAIGKKLYFAAKYKKGRALWVSDGTKSGTGIVLTFGGGSRADVPSIAQAGSKVCLVARRKDADVKAFQVWSTDGKIGDTGQRLTTVLRADAVYTFSNRCYALVDAGNSWEALWVTDGSKAGTSEVDAGPVGALRVGPDGLDYSKQSGDDVKLRRITAPGAAPVTRATLPDVQADYYPTEIASAGGKTYTTVLDVNVITLWVTDGTELGTQEVSFTSAQPLPAEFERFRRTEYALTPIGDALLFEYLDGTGVEVWRTDGTPAGTESLGDLNRDVVGDSYDDDSIPRRFSRIIGPVGDSMLLTADDGLTGVEPWITDGTPSGTQSLGDLDTTTANALEEDSQLAVIRDGYAYFVADDGAHGKELWRTDGTPANTELVVDATPGRKGSRIGGMVATDSAVFFVVIENISGDPAELWVTDGTSAGSAVISPTNQFELAVVGDRVAFDNGGLWVTDGTSAGTEQLHTGYVANLTTVGATLYFAGQGAVGGGAELWSSDGTTGGTGLVASIRAGAESSNPNDFTEFDGRVYFFADDGSGSKLWRTDGTKAGTKVFSDFDTAKRLRSGGLHVVNDTLYAVVRIFFQNQQQLWASDGSKSGTKRVKTFDGQLLGAAGNYLAFINDDALWRSNGTVSGTKPVPGVQGQFVGWATTASGQLYFTLDPPGMKPGVYRTNATASGTQRLAAVAFAPEGFGSFPYPAPNPKRLGTDLLYGSWDVEYGAELRVIPLP